MSNKLEFLAIPKHSPTLRGDAAKRFIEEMENRKHNRELFERCRELAKLFRMEG